MPKPQQKTRKRTPRFSVSRQQLYALIETGCAQLGLDEQTKRDLFFSETRCRSKTEMDEYALSRVIARLRADGFKEIRPTKSPKNSDEYLLLLWGKLKAAGRVDDGSERALNAWVEHQTRKPNGGIGVSSYKLLTQRQISALIERAKAWVKGD